MYREQSKLESSITSDNRCFGASLERPDPGLGPGYPGPKSDPDPWAGPGSKTGPNWAKNCPFLTIFWGQNLSIFQSISNDIGTCYSFALK